MKINKLCGDKNFNVAYYIPEIWNARMGIKHKDDIIDYKDGFDNCIFNAVDVITNFGINDKDINNILFVPLDEKYYDWLKKNNLTHDSKTSSRYALEAQYKDAHNAWEKYNLGNCYYLCAVIFEACFNSTQGGYSSMSIDKSTCDRLEKKLAGIFDGCEVWVPGDVIPEEKFIDDGDKYWDNHTGKRFRNYGSAEYLHQDNGYGENTGLYCVSYIVHDRLDCLIHYPEVDFDYNAAKSDPYMLIPMDETWDKEFKNCIKNAEESFVVTIAGVDQVDEACDDICEMIDEMSEEQEEDQAEEKRKPCGPVNHTSGMDKANNIIEMFKKKNE